MALKFGDEKDLTFQDFVPFIQNELGKTEWITIFEFFDKKYPSVDRGTFFCALIPNSMVDKCLEKADWDLLIGRGGPSFISSYQDGKETSEYFRFGDYSGIEPFVYWKSYRSRGESVIDISEEFRHYFDLFESAQDDKRTFIYTNDDGDDEEVLVVSENKVEIKLKYLKEFLAVKKMNLAVYFEAMRFLPTTLEEAGVEHIDDFQKEDSYAYSLWTRDLQLGESKSQGWVLGKKFIAGAKDFKFSFWQAKEDERFEDFIVGVDEEGSNILASSNTTYQSSPNFLTPVFFKREVLKKYYDAPDTFSVEDGYLRREGGFWGLRMMNNCLDHVVVWLGDLKDMPYKEQAHWRSFNLTPGDRKIARCDFVRNIEGQFCDSEHPELYFKYKFKIFQDAWNKKFGWYLFQPLNEGDQYHMKSLHIPTTDGEKEFEDQVMSISKILIDSLNQKELSKGLQNPKESPGKIDWFEVFLLSQGCDRPKMFEFLKKLQALRSSAIAHRKGDKMNSAYKYFELDTKSRIDVFEDMIIRCIWIFNSLNKEFQLGLEKD